MANILDAVEAAEIAANKAVESMAKEVLKMRKVGLNNKVYDGYQRIIATNLSDEYTYPENTKLVQASFYWDDELESFDSFYVYFPELYLEYSTWRVAERGMIDNDNAARAAKQEYRRQQEMNRKRALFEELKRELGE